ncbi:MAG: hypothetical protein KatS3mg105_4687 [Gemmatales bacterium]|nr:MAG: hypothetical protein KatS3mg105_4687 [Gemmatales bacterium]
MMSLSMALMGVVIVDAIVDLPCLYFVLLIAVLAGAMFAVGRTYRFHDFDRLRSCQSLSFELRSGRICFTGDFNFRQTQTLDAPQERCTVGISLSEEAEAISLIRIWFELSRLEEKEVVVPVDYGLIYITDGLVIHDTRRQEIVRNLISSRLPAPIFEELKDENETFGVVVEPGAGNGTYVFKATNGFLECDSMSIRTKN